MSDVVKMFDPPMAVMAPPAPAIYRCIAAVSLELSKEGISKDRKNEQQGYKFRGIDDVYNAIAPIIARQGLVILPRILSRAVTERTTAKGGVLFYVVVEAEFDFVASADGSRHVVRTYGEAMDSGDKATNKAMSAAYKYAAFQTFCIPTEGNNDADETTHVDVLPSVPAGYLDWRQDMEALADNGLPAVAKAFRESPEAFRDYATKHDDARWKALKAKATTKTPALEVKA